MIKNEIEIRQKNLENLLDEMQELSQPRSDYALKHFVVGQHDLPARQRQQAIIELQGLMFELANQADEIKLAELDIIDFEKQLSSSSGTDADRLRIQIAKKERQIKQINIMLTGRLRECDTLYAMLQEIPKFTAAELEEQEEAYWSRRLTRQYVLGQRDVGGNLTAILEMLTDPGEEKPQLIPNLSDVISAIGLSEGSIVKYLEKELSGGKE